VSFKSPGHESWTIQKSSLPESAAESGTDSRGGTEGIRGERFCRRARGRDCAARINKRMLYHYFRDKEGLFREVLRRKLAERAAWLASAPDDPVEDLSYWFQLACRDHDWVRLLEWEALQWGGRKVIDENHRQAAFVRAVERIRRQQADGQISAALDPAQLLLSMMALTAYPLAFPQLARLASGLSVSGAKFKKQRLQFLRQFAAALKVAASAPAGFPRQEAVAQ
jgi:AcrR family transcriptional regulator